VTTPARIRVIAAAALSAAALAPAASAATVDQLVVFRDGSAVQKQVSTRAATVRVGRRRCAVGAATPLAALVRSRIGALRLKDYGSCSKRAADAAGLYVRKIRRDAARGTDGWVYKVGDKVAPAGAADPTGPFGRGRLRSSARVTWFYCRMKAAGCQRTLGVKKAADANGVTVTVRSYDDRGRGKPAAGATVRYGAGSATADADGVAHLPAGATGVWADAPGMVRSFTEG
jgi:hypothetical protein